MYVEVESHRSRRSVISLYVRIIAREGYGYIAIQRTGPGPFRFRLVISAKPVLVEMGSENDDTQLATDIHGGIGIK